MSIPHAPRWRVALEALPLTLALILALYWLLAVDRSATDGKLAPLRPVTAASAAELEAVFAAAGYTWPPAGPVPRLALQQLPPDLAELPVERRKALFFSALTPLVLAENERLRQTRTWLQDTLRRPSWSAEEERQLAALAERFAVKGRLDDPATQRRLLERIDEIPLGLALVQAAKESGWGTSRFAQEARNLFGVWTWDANNGLIPAARQPGQRHLVRVFPNLQAAVRNYLHTLNTGAVYAPLRQLRAQMRAAGEPLQPLLLAAGLERYSERRAAYVREVRQMLVSNGLDRLDSLPLAP